MWIALLDADPCRRVLLLEEVQMRTATATAARRRWRWSE